VNCGLPIFFAAPTSCEGKKRYPRIYRHGKKLAEALQREGFLHRYVWEDGPNTFYAEHVHNDETAHIIVNGELTLIMGHEARTYRAGDRCEVPAGAAHGVRMGPNGCRYLVGER
jgi:mannose-6-phosphate isomerase-like protein (cupin superfamily)